jgi:hypothetical protein
MCGGHAGEGGAIGEERKGREWPKRYEARNRVGWLGRRVQRKEMSCFGGWKGKREIGWEERKMLGKRGSPRRLGLDRGFFLFSFY